MKGKDAMMASSGDDREKALPACLRSIASAKLYSSCETHLSEERIFYCRVCLVALCKECKEATRSFQSCNHAIILWAYKASKGPSFRREDLDSLWDICDICSYSQNGCLVACIHKRGAGIARSGYQSGFVECESCQYGLKSPGANYCSVECKVEAAMKMNGSGSTMNEAKRKVEAISEGSATASNVQSFRKRPRKQKNPRRAPLH